EGGEVDDPVDQARRAGDLAVRAEAPADIAGRGVERVEDAVERADQDKIPPDGRRGVDIAAGRVRPAQLSGARAVGVDLPVRRADEDSTVGDRGRGVEPARMPEAWLGRGTPDLPTGPSVERVDVTVVRADIDLSVRVRRGAF